MRTRKKFILVPFDFSPCSLQAARIAFMWAHCMQCEIVFLNACTKLDEKEHYAQTEKLQEQLNGEIASNQLPAVTFSFQFKCGVPEDEIKHFAKRNHPLLIIMGTRNKTQKQDDMIGSVTAEVLEDIKIPVLAVPDQTSLKPLDEIQNIAVATSLGKNQKVDFTEMARILPDFRGTVHLIHILEETNKSGEKKASLDKLCEQLKTVYPQITIIPELLTTQQSKARELNQFVEMEKIDLLVVRKANRTWFLSRLLFPSTAQNLVFHAETPLLVV